MVHTLVLLAALTVGWGLAVALMAVAPRLSRWGDRRAFHQLALFAPLLSLALAGGWSVKMVVTGCLMFTTADGVGTLVLMLGVAALLGVATVRESWRIMHAHRQIDGVASPMPRGMLRVNLKQLADRLKVKRPRVRLLKTDRLVACVAGVARPVFFVSSGLLERLSVAEREAIAAHELAHLRHQDNFLAWLDVILLRAFAFVPPMHHAWRESLAEREEAADAQAATATGKPLELASALVKVAEAGGTGLGPEVSAIAALCDDARLLERRVERLLAFKPGAEQACGWPTAAAIAIGMALPFVTAWILGFVTSCLDHA